jgi:hypothetical protein
MENPLQMLFSSPWFWIVLVLIILIVAFRAQLARLIDRTQKAKVEAGKDGARFELEANAPPVAEKAPPAPPPSTATPHQSVQVGQGAVMRDTHWGDIGNVIVKTAPGPAPAPVKPPSPSSSASSWNTAVIRELLTAAFSDEELTTLCFDFFLPVHSEFASGMTLGQKIQRLIEHCQRHDQFDRLLDIVRERNPVQYLRYERRLKS